MRPSLYLCLLVNSFNNCINGAVHKIFGVRSAECINDVRRFVGLEDVTKLVETRRSKFIEIVYEKHVNLCLAAVHILDGFSINAVFYCKRVYCLCDTNYI